MLGGPFEPLARLLGVFGAGYAAHQISAHIILSILRPVFGSLPGPEQALLRILGNAVSVVVKPGEAPLGQSISLLGSLFIPESALGCIRRQAHVSV